jgi:hypothetical protein
VKSVAYMLPLQKCIFLSLPRRQKPWSWKIKIWTLWNTTVHNIIHNQHLILNAENSNLMKSNNDCSFTSYYLLHLILSTIKVNITWLHTTYHQTLTLQCLLMLIIKARWDMCHIHEHSNRHRKIGQRSLCSLWWDVTDWIMSPGIQIDCNTSTIYVRVIEVCKLLLGNL